MLRTGFKRSAGPIVGVFVLGIFFAGLGGFMLTKGFGNYQDGRETESWATTSGRVLASTIDERTRTNTTNGRSRTETSYVPVVVYEYAVAGTTFEGNDIRVDDHAGNYARAQEILAGYPVGETTTVYYDPNSPADAVLEQGADMEFVYMLGGGGAVVGTVGLGALAFLGSFARRQRRGAI